MWCGEGGEQSKWGDVHLEQQTVDDRDLGATVRRRAAEGRDVDMLRNYSILVVRDVTGI